MREETIDNCFATVIASECTNILIDLRQCMLLTQVEKSLYLRRNIINAHVLMQFCSEAFLIDHSYLCSVHTLPNFLTQCW